MKEEIKKLNEIFFEREMKKKARLSKRYAAAAAAAKSL